MKIELPINYHAYYKLPRKSSWESVVMQAPYSGTIREVPADDVFHAFTVSNVRGSLPEKVHVFDNDYKAIKIISHDGKFYAQRFSVENALDVFGATPLSEGYRQSSVSPLFGHTVLKNSEYFRHDATIKVGFFEPDAPKTRAEVARRLKIDDLKRWTEDKQLAIKNADTVLSRFIAVDGQVYERVNEPVFKIIPSESGICSLYVEEVRERNRVRSYFYHETNADTICYGLDEFDKAKEALELLASRRGIDGRNNVRLEFVDPSFVTFRGESQMLYDFSRSVAAEVVSSGYGRAFVIFQRVNQQMTTGLYDLKVAVEKNETTTPELLRAVSSVVNAWKNHTDIWSIIDRDTFDEYELGAAESLYEQLGRYVRGLEERLFLYNQKEESTLDWNMRKLDTPQVIEGDLRIFQVTSMSEVLKCNVALETDLRAYTRPASEGTGELIAVENYMTGKIVAAGFYPIVGAQFSEETWATPAYSKNDVLFKRMRDYVNTAAPSPVELNKELDALGL